MRGESENPGLRPGLAETAFQAEDVDAALRAQGRGRPFKMEKKAPDSTIFAFLLKLACFVNRGILI